MRSILLEREVNLLKAYWRLYRSLAPEVRRFLWLSASVEYQYLGIYLFAFNLYLLRLDFGPGFIGVATGSGIAVYSMTALLSGYVFRRRSVCGLVINGALLIIGGLIGVACTDLLPTIARAPWVLVMNAFAWMGGGFYGVGRLPYMVAVAPRDQRVLTFALERMMGIAFAFLGSLALLFVPALTARLLGTTLDDPAPYRVALLLAPAGLIPPLLLFAAASRRAPPLDETKDDVADIGPRSVALAPGAMILLLAGYAVFFNFASTPPLYFFNVYLDEGLAVSPALIAFVMGAARLGSLPATFLLPVLTRRWAVGRILVVIALVLSLALIPLALVPHALVASLSYLTCSLLLAVYEPFFDLFRMEAVPSSLQTRMAGATQTATFGAQSAAGFMGGYAVVALGYSPMFLGAACLAFAAAVLLGSAHRRDSSSYAIKHPPTPSRTEA